MSSSNRKNDKANKLCLEPVRWASFGESNLRSVFRRLNLETVQFKRSVLRIRGGGHLNVALRGGAVF